MCTFASAIGAHYYIKINAYEEIFYATICVSGCTER